MATDSDLPTPDAISALQTMVTTAARLADSLAADPLLAKLIEIFGRIPVEEREPIIAILEREIDLHNLGRAAKGGPLAGINPTHINPNARLYMRATDGGPPAYVSHEEIAHAMVRAGEVMHRAFQRRSDLAEIWEPAVLAGLRSLPPEERESLLTLHRRIVELIESVMAERA
jgi:hypothetical protein